MNPILYLIPTPLGTADTPCLLPHEQAQIIGLTDFVVEAEKTAQRSPGWHPCSGLLAVILIV